MASSWKFRRPEFHWPELNNWLREKNWATTTRISGEVVHTEKRPDPDGADG